MLSEFLSSASLLATRDVQEERMQMVVTGMALIFWIGILIVGISYYRDAVKIVARGEGKVASLPFGIPDLLALTVAGFWLIAMIASSLVRGSDESGPITVQGIYQSTLFFAVIVALLAWFMENRKISVKEMCSFRKLGLWKTLKEGGLYMILGLSFIHISMLVTSLLLKEKAEPQRLIEFFHNAARANDYQSILAVAFSAVIVAPLMEEFIFRGYVYGVLRRYVGPWGGMVLASLAFAAIHFNLLSFPSLFVLALCFTLAYEATGSLLVPMTMHAIFNCWNLIEVFSRAVRDHV